MLGQGIPSKRKSMREINHEVGMEDNNNKYKMKQNLIEEELEMVPIPIKPEFQLLFCKANNIVANMVIALQQVFQSYGITLTIKDYHSSILKMIMPTQLLCYVQFCKTQKKFKEKAMNMLYPFRSNQLGMKSSSKGEDHRKNYKKQQEYMKDIFKDFSKDNEKNQINQKKINTTTTTQKSSELGNKKQNSDGDLVNQQQNDQQPYEQQQYPSEFKYNVRKIRRKPVLDKQLQKKLCNWLTSQVKEGKPVTIDHFAQKARILVNRKTFVGSAGWCRRFFSDHPMLRGLLSRRHYYQPKRISFNFARQFDEVSKNSMIAKTADINHDLPCYEIKQYKQQKLDKMSENSSSLSSNEYLDEFIRKEENKKKDKEKQKYNVSNHFRETYDKLKSKKKFYRGEIQQ